jgi:hypothetical protein
VEMRRSEVVGLQVGITASSNEVSSDDLNLVPRGGTNGISMND